MNALALQAFHLFWWTTINPRDTSFEQRALNTVDEVSRTIRLSSNQKPTLSLGGHLEQAKGSKKEKVKKQQES